MELKKRWVSLVLMLLMIFSYIPAANAYSDDLSSKQNQLKNIQGNMNNIKNKMSDVKDEKNSVLDQVTKLDQQINSVNADIGDLNAKIGSTNDNIEATTTQLNKAMEDYGSYKDLYSERIREIYINGPAGYLDILLSANSFADLISRMDIVGRIMKFDSGILTGMKQKQDDISSKQQQLQSQKLYLVKLQQDSLNKKATLADASQQKKAYVAKLDNDLATLKKALDEEAAESQKLNSEINDLIAKSNVHLVYSGKRYAIVKVSDLGYYPRITSPFGMRYHPVLHTYKLHTGIDLGVKAGTPVYAMADGVVIIAQYNVAYGNMVVIDHGSGITTLYAHNTRLLVKVGEKVNGGQQISISGSTGYSTGPHVHFEVRKNGTPIDPAPYLIIGK